jgi:hypothetical protein
VSSLLLAAAPAAAAVVRLTGEYKPSSGPIPIVLDGDHVTGLTASLSPQACAGPSTWRQSADSGFTLHIVPADGVELSGGRFSFRGTATSAYPGADATGPYGGEMTVTGTVNPSHTFMSGTVTLSGAHDPFVHGCSAAKQFIAVAGRSTYALRPDRRAFQSRFISFDYAAGVVRSLSVIAQFNCGQSIDQATVTGRAYGLPTIQASQDGSFRVRNYVFDEYGQIVSFTLTGRISGGSAVGRIVVDEPPGGFVGQTGVRCHGAYRWRASRPVPPPPPGPSAFFQWAAIRVPVDGAYRYYFAVTGMRCTHHATEVLVTVGGRTIAVPCSRRVSFASGPLSPTRSYLVRSRAVEAGHRRTIRHGPVVAVPLAMPGPGDRWVPISGLPGRPPP